MNTCTFIYGAGDWGMKAATFYGLCNIDGFIDNDLRKREKHYFGLPVMNYSEFILKKYKKCLVIIANRNHRESIAQQLCDDAIEYVFYSPDIEIECGRVMNYIRAYGISEEMKGGYYSEAF